MRWSASRGPRTLAVDCLAWSARARVVAARAGVFLFDYLVLVRVFGSNRLRILVSGARSRVFFLGVQRSD